MDEQNRRDPIPEFDTLQQIADFWDTHSTADYDDLTYPVELEVRLQHGAQRPEAIRILPELSEKLQAVADARGVSVETLVNVWLTEKVLELA
ncbi:MAG: hypothetical protein HYR71_06760 [Chloroflexi bacterium]|nr:hypothetical protein [Chloroflexota bacterium]